MWCDSNVNRLLRLFCSKTSVLAIFIIFAHSSAYALDTTAPGALTIEPAHESIEVVASYVDDDNTDNSLTVYWATEGTDWADASVESVTLENQPSPYRYIIGLLQNFQPYQVKVVYNDDDGISNGLQEQVANSLIPYNKLVHSSYTTGSLKWSASGGWGVPDAKYGEFVCLTCHGLNTGNIKRVKADIVVTDTGSTDTFPIQDDIGTVTFQTTLPGQSDFGDDEELPTDSSHHICEACHSQNKFHNYNSAVNTEGSDHYNREDCTSCHQHKEGFKPGCVGCHPEEPTMASHDEHLNSAILAVDLGCQTCHSNSVHRNTLSEVRFDSSDPAVSGASYSEEGGDESSCFDEVSGYCGTPTYGTCDNLYCHSNADPLSGANTYAQPIWGGAQMVCDSCHDTGGALTDLSTRHDIHTDFTTYDFSCAKCHIATVYNSTTIKDAAQHIDLQKDVVFSSGGTYNSALVCSSTYCHSDGAGNDPNVTVAWTDNGSLGCVGCHNGRIIDAPTVYNSQMLSNGHHRLANEAWIRQYPCEYCHYDTVDTDDKIKSFTKHVNEIKDIAFDPKWKIVGYPDPSYNVTAMVCDNLYCHSDGTTVTPQVRDFPWDLGEHAKCDSCHGHQTDDDCSACHPDGAPVVSVEDQWKMATPMYNSTGPGTPRANSHLRHLETEFACENCHRDTVVGSCNTASCHDGGVPNGDMSEVGHVFADYHVNKVKDVIFKDGGSYDHATKTCSNTACHTGPDPQWGDSRNGAILCLTCHGTTEADVDDYGAFNGTRAKINMTEWESSGHGRQTASGPYTSGNSPANFPGNPCWYCHDNEVLHNDVTNPYRLKEHPQFEKRFDKECVYCHMEQKDDECLGCHNDPNSLSVYQLDVIPGHIDYADGDPSCLTSDCHLPQDPGNNGDQCRTCHDPGSNQNAPELDDATEREGLAGQKYKISEIQVGMSTAPYAVDHIEFRGGGAYETVSCMATSMDWPPTGCHAPDVHIHNTNSGTWTASQKSDVKNQYVMMGVCLQCHDDDSNDRCTTCHTWSGDPADNPYTLGYDPGTGLNSGSSHASSSHFGFKHFGDYESSLENVVDSGVLSEVSSGDDKNKTTRLVDTTQSWPEDELVGKAVEITSGSQQGEIRSILVNSYNAMTLSGLFEADLTAGTSYDILGTVWKGGKFCWDCHDPHGDSNIYMIHDDVALTTDGLFGKPLERASVTFTRTLSGLDYAQSTGAFDGICNVCHTNVDHYQKDYGDNHRSGRRCTDCHEHGFAAGHGSGQSCDACHDNKPLPNHLGFGQPRDCTKCHDGVVNKRMDIMRQFRGQSHHIQGIEVTNDHCYECHWEATSFGLIDNDYHAGYNYKTHDAVMNAKTDLVIWDSTERPERYALNTTAVIFNAVTIGTNDERDHVTNVTQHCLGCHNDDHNDVSGNGIFGDCKTPNQYAWDGTSIAARYEQTGTAMQGKYTGYAEAAKRNQTKAFSAHGKATLNQGGWDSATGEDGDLSSINTRAGDQNVQCYDCHSSHGSYTTGVTSSYRTFDNSFGGANLKETQAGKGGYSVTYKAGEVVNGSSTLNPGAAQCFDCHLTRDAGAKPWGYFSTFGAEEPITGYRDSAYFDGLDNGVKSRFSYRAGKTGVSGHYTHISSDPVTPPEEQVNGLCSGCHDPHGVSPTLGDNRAYAVPLLKGTWLTSPYKEDSPQINTTTNVSSSDVQIDRRTFGDLTNRTHISEDADQFAGLCLRCHPKESLTDDYDPEIGTKPTWQSMRRVHQSVKGWGSNKEHQFPCSKCHQPHSSGLQRLMRTNCLDWNHRGVVESGGPAPSWRSETEHYPRLRNRYQPCHQSVGAGGTGENSSNFRNQQWNTVTPW